MTRILRSLGRREFVAAGMGAFVVAAVPVAVRRRRSVTRRTVPVMGTLAEFTVVHRDSRVAEGAIDAAYAELRDVEERMTRFRPDSEIGRVNAMAYEGPVVVSAATMAVLDAAMRWARVSEGRFDPAIGRVVELWDVANRNAPPPDEPRQRLAGRHFYRKVALGIEGGEPAVMLSDADVHIDLGAIAKGYAVDRAAEALRASGIAHALINVGGEVVAVGGWAPGEPWRVGIAKPDDPRAAGSIVELMDGAIATSGDYEQYFRWRGRRYHHLMDPDTAAPRLTAMHSVTIRAATCMDADAAATAVFGAHPSVATRILAGAATDCHLISVA